MANYNTKRQTNRYQYIHSYTRMHKNNPYRNSETYSIVREHTSMDRHSRTINKKNLDK